MKTIFKRLMNYCSVTVHFSNQLSEKSLRFHSNFSLEDAGHVWHSSTVNSPINQPIAVFELSLICVTDEEWQIHARQLWALSWKGKKWVRVILWLVRKWNSRNNFIGFEDYNRKHFSFLCSDWLLFPWSRIIYACFIKLFIYISVSLP